MSEPLTEADLDEIFDEHAAPIVRDLRTLRGIAGTEDLPEGSRVYLSDEPGGEWVECVIRHDDEGPIAWTLDGGRVAELRVSPSLGVWIGMRPEEPELAEGVWMTSMVMAPMGDAVIMDVAPSRKYN